MFIALLLAFAANAHAQGLIWVKGPNSDALFGDVAAAYNAAQPGDKIYLPGGAFVLPDLDKEVHVVGVGWDRRMTAATGPSFITNSPTLLGGAAHSSLEGLRFAGQLYLRADHVTVKRCYMAHLEVYENLAGNVFIQNVILSCGVRYTSGAQTVAYFYNNVMRDLNVWTDSRADLANNVFLRPIGQALYIKNGVFRKNIVLRGALPYGVYECINVVVEDNVFSTGQILNGPGNNCPQAGNMVNVPIEDIFENVPDQTADFLETYDFRLKPNSPARFGTPESADDAGIYGGDYPWKDGLLPANPHVDAKLAPPSAAGNNLNVRLRVSAQSE